MIEGIPTLWDKALDKAIIPAYPTYELVTANTGDITFDLDTSSPALKTFKREATEGELIRDADLRYLLDTRKNMAYRINVTQQAMNNPEYQQLQIFFCKSSILYFVNTFVYTYNPQNTKNPYMPLVTFPFQDEMLEWCLWLIENKETGLIEKSREMGCTWIGGACIAAYLILFFPGFEDYQLSLREDDVDNRKANSLLGKLRIILSYLPEWMRGGWKEGINGIDNKMAIQIPDTKSSVLGQLTGGTAGRGSRATRGFYDEFAFVDDSESVLEANSSLASSELFLSTVHGMGNAFARMAHDPRMHKMTLHWTLHPLKNEMWAKKERAKAKYTEEIWAQEHEIAYEKSKTGRVYHEFTSFTASKYDWAHVQQGLYYQYDPNYDVYLGLDFGMADPTSAVFAQIKPAPEHFGNTTSECLVIFEEYEAGNMVVDEWAKLINGKNFIYRHVVGDFRSGNQRDATGNTWCKYLRQHGIHVVGKYNTEQAPIMEVKRLLERPGAFAINKEKCPHLIQAFQNWSYPIDKRTGLVITDSKPKHDQFSHSMKAMCYLVDYIYGHAKSTTKRPENWDFRIMSNTGRMM